MHHSPDRKRGAMTGTTNRAAIELYRFESAAKPAAADESAWNRWSAEWTRLHRAWFEACKHEADYLGMSRSTVSDSSWTFALHFA